MAAFRWKVSEICVAEIGFFRLNNRSTRIYLEALETNKELICYLPVKPRETRMPRCAMVTYELSSSESVVTRKVSMRS